jgi:branched-chain amino acid transport system substrate-binding protein
MGRDSGSTSRWEYIDFDLEIREGNPPKYLVFVRSPEGEVEEEVSFPFDVDGWELKYKLKAMEQAVGRSGGTRRRIIRSQEEQVVQDFGRTLYKALLHGEVGAHYKSTLRAAEREKKGLRLKLHIHPSELTVLPWEFLYDPGRDEYLCLSPNTPLVRYLNLDQPVKQLPVTPPLRILGMVSNPRDLPELNVEDEKRRVDEAIEFLRKDGLIELTWLKGQTWSDLQEAMWWGDSWHIFHFIGHGDFDPVSGEGRIALSDEDGRQDLLGARNLARLLDSHDPLRLVYLNSCQGAQSSEGDAFSSTAATLVRRGIPAVLAMQYEITDSAAIAFARVFYRAVASSLPVDAAVSAGRTAVSMNNTLEWVTPVLYMRSPDGCIFDFSSEAQSDAPKDSLSRYRESVESIWADGELHEREVEWLRDYANDKLELSPSTTAEIEREVMGNTIEAILERQTRDRKEEERQKQLYELYAQALQYMDAEEWSKALECLEGVQRLEPGYQDTETLLSQARHELAKPSTIEVPDLSGQGASQARSTLENRGLKLGDREEILNDAIPEGEIVRQSPEAGMEVEAGSSVGVTLSSGPSTVKVPDLTSLNRSEASTRLAAAGLVLGNEYDVPSGAVVEGRIFEQNPAAGTKVQQGSSVSIRISSGPEKKKTGKRLLVAGFIAAALVVGIGYTIANLMAEASGTPTATIVSDFPLQGPGQKENEPLVNAIKLALEERDYMAGDVQIEYTSQDDATPRARKWDEAKCEKNAESAAQKEEIVGWIGPGNSGCAKVQIPILNQAGLAMVSPAATHIGLTKPDSSPDPDEPKKYYPTDKRNFTRVIVADDEQGSAAANWMKHVSGVESVFILDDNDIYGKGVADQFEYSARELGIRIVDHQSIDLDATNYRSLMDQIAQLNPDAIYFGGGTQSKAGQLVKDKTAAGMSNEDVIFMGADGIMDQAFLTAAGDEAESIYVTFPGLPASELPQKGQEFVERYEERFPDSGYAKYTAHAYEAANVLLEAIDKAYQADGRVTRGGVARQLFATENYDGVLGTWSFDEYGDTTLTKVSGHRVKNGAFDFDRTLDTS